MLDYRKDTSGKKPFAPSSSEHGGTLCRIAHRTITNHFMSLRLRHIEDRGAVNGNAQLRKISSQHPGVQPGGLLCPHFAGSGEIGKPSRSGRLAPVGRPQTGNAPPLLIDQYGRVRATYGRPQVRDQRPDLSGIDAVAGKENETQRIGIDKKGALGRC
jgi:hypothetical protein